MTTAREKFFDAQKRLKECSKRCEEFIDKKEKEQLGTHFHTKCKDKKKCLQNAQESKSIKTYTECVYPKCKTHLDDFTKLLIDTFEEDVVEWQNAIKERKQIIAKLKNKQLSESQMKKIIAGMTITFSADVMKYID